MRAQSDPEALLGHPTVKKAVGTENTEVKQRREFKPRRCAAFTHPYLVLKETDRYRFTIDREARRQLPRLIGNNVQIVEGTDSPSENLKNAYARKRNIGIVFSGGPAPGGHNVIAGLYDAAKQANPDNAIFGFLMGPDGIIENQTIQLTDDIIDAYRNMGGFTMIKTGRTKIDTPEKIFLSGKNCRELEIDALVIVGGDDSNTNAAFLAQEMHDDGILVIGVPKTIDGDVQVRDADGNVLCAISFGFHSAALAFSNDIGNLCVDAASTAKYWHVCKVMGRVASHLALETALQTHVNLALIGEDLADYVDTEKVAHAEKSGVIDFSAYGITLKHLSRIVCDAIMKRAAVGKNYGVIVVPEGVLEFVNEIQMFIVKLNTIIADYTKCHPSDFHTALPRLKDKLAYLEEISGKIAVWSKKDDLLFNEVPSFFQEGLLMERDSHGNFPFSQVKTETILIRLVKQRLKELQANGQYKIGISEAWYRRTLEKNGLDPNAYGPILFGNFGESEFLLVKPSIVSTTDLKRTLKEEKMIPEDGGIPASVEKIFKASVPQFKTQEYFYGYDGRGSDPTEFDSTYTYNLGMTVFGLIANGATGQMAAIRNLEHGFDKWEPIGIPIAPLMHLEERKGKQTLVLEKCVVGLDSPAFRVAKACRERWLAAVPGNDDYRRPDSIRLTTDGMAETGPITLTLNALEKSRI